MNTIKEYKPLALVFYTTWDWEQDILPIDDSKAEDFKDELENSKFVTIGWRTINTYNVREVRRDEDLTSVQKIYYSQPKGFKEYVKRRMRGLGYGWTFSQFEKECALPKVMEKLLQWIEDFKLAEKDG